MGTSKDDYLLMRGLGFRCIRIKTREVRFLHSLSYSLPRFRVSIQIRPSLQHHVLETPLFQL
eukprot:snap_masked-scaffold_9-processed-gene-3.30-mRNA-1 protein AED:1.00 eAED:1.00 QI:0/0/0/0/1/1/2/0/61